LWWCGTTAAAKLFFLDPYPCSSQ
jgi:hypothetical protein